MAVRIERTERLLNLVICLMASAHAVSRAEIRRQIPGYSHAPSDAAFERMFERDKDELRSMAIPVETVSDPNGEVLGYRIPRDEYELRDLELTASERAALAVAAQVWSRAVVAPLAGTALRKLETLEAGVEEWTPADLQGTVQLTARDAALVPLMSAIRQDRVAAFAYQTPTDDEPHPREVSPWGLRSSAGRWFLIAFDHDRQAVRTFRLSRISGPVTVAAREREQQPPTDFDISSVDATADDTTIRAVLRVAAGRGAALRRMSQDADALSSEVVVVTGMTLDEVAVQVCAGGPDVVVIEPPELQDAVCHALIRLLDAHADGTR